MNKPVLPILMLIFSTASFASYAQEATVSKYAGQEERPIKSLSSSDIEELQRGGGWGLAKAAELNGVPGPAHLLDMQKEVPLDEAQIAALTKIFDEMKRGAIQKGEQLIELERELEAHFQNHTITDAILRESLAKIAKVRMELRYIHLSTHLMTPEILSESQIENYNALRGYSNPDPCANIPAGHDAAMWRKHNGCE